MTKILNLDPQFKPYGINTLNFKQFEFSSGCEPHIKICENFVDKVIITHRIQNHNDFLLICLAVDALRRINSNVIIDLFMPYLPFARQDRVMVKGEPLSVKVFANLLNSLELNSVIIYDLHSDVGSALINNCKVIKNNDFVVSCFNYLDACTIVSPDAGATKKIYQLAQDIGYKGDIIEITKQRDVTNGKITNISCHTVNFDKQNLVIIDDICDGGATFLMLAQYLKQHNAGKLALIVSHGLFSQGITKLKDVFDCIFTTNSINRGEIKDITVYDLKLSNDALTEKEYFRLNA